MELKPIHTLHPVFLQPFKIDVFIASHPAQINTRQYVPDIIDVFISNIKPVELLSFRHNPINNS